MIEQNTKKQKPAYGTAHDWYVRMSDERISAADRAEFERWLASDPAHAADYANVDALWKQLHTLQGAHLDSEVMDSLQTARRHSTHQKRAWWPRAAWAASAACILLVVLIAFFIDSNSPLPVQDSRLLAQRFTTVPAQIDEIRLEDGSLAVLGADSAIDVSFSADSRDVTLIHGEAFFDVISDTRRPFRVAAGELDIRVTGTVFGVRLGAASAEVSVGEGSVDVSYPLMVAGVAMNQKELRRLNAGSAVTATPATGLGKLRSVSPHAIASWRQGRLAYVAAPLAEVIADANRYSARHIVIVDPELESIEVSGSFDAVEIDATLDTLAEIFPLQIDRSGSGPVRIIHQP